MPIDFSQHTGTIPSTVIRDSTIAGRALLTAASASAQRTAIGGGANKISVNLGAISTKASDAAVIRYVSPVAGTIDKIYSALNAALATGDATLTAAIGGSAVTSGVITITQASSAAGDIDSCTPSAANTVAVGSLVTITGGGASTATSTASVSMLITPTA